MGFFGLTRSKPERDPTLTEILTRLVELEDEWRAFLTQQTRYAARMAKRAKDDLKHVEDPAPTLTSHKAELRRRAMALRGNFRGGTE